MPINHQNLVAKTRGFWLFGAYVVILAGLVGGCGAQREAAPAVELTLLSGAKHGAAQFKGKVSLVNFWATSCASCVKEMPDIVKTYERYSPKGFEVLAVAMSYDPPNYVVNYVETRKLPFKVAIDHQGTAAKAFPDVKVTPTSFLIDKQGRIAKRWVGEPDFAALGTEIERLLAENPS
jgi:peroxiredoxin